MLIKAGATSRSVDLFFSDSSSTTGDGLPGLAYNSAGLTCYYRKGATGTLTAVTLATQTVGGAYSSGGFVKIDDTNAPGLCRFDIPDAAIDTLGFTTFYFKGATNMAPLALRVQCVAFNPEDTVRLGLTALPNVAQGNSGQIALGDASGRPTVAAIVADAVNASALATDAVAEIRNGLGLSAANLDTQLSGINAKTTNLPSDPADASDIASAFSTVNSTLSTIASYIDTEVSTILNRLGAFTGSGVNTVLGFLKALGSKTASTPSDMGGTFDPATDSGEAIRDRGDAAWTTGGGGGGGGGGVTLLRGPYQGKVNDGRPGAVVPLSVDDMVTLVIDVVDENGDEVPTGTATYTTEVRDRAGATVSTGTATPSDDATRGRITWGNAAEDTESARTLYLHITRTDGAQVDTLRPIVLSIT